MRVLDSLHPGDRQQNRHGDADALHAGSLVDIDPFIQRMSPAGAAAGADRDGRDAHTDGNVRIS